MSNPAVAYKESIRIAPGATVGPCIDGRAADMLSEGRKRMTRERVGSETIEEEGGGRPHLVTGILGAGGVVAVAVGIGWRFADVLPPGSLVSLFLVAVLAAAALFGLSAGLVAALASFFALNWFFVEPFYTFDVADPHEVFALGVFLVAAILTGGLAGRLRESVDEARRRADTLALLHDFGERIAGASTLDDVRLLAVRHLGTCVGGPVVLADRAPDGTEVWEGSAGPWSPSEAERRAVDRVYATGLPADDPASGRRFRPLATASGIVAVIGLDAGAERRGGDDDRGLDALVAQAAAALERARFAEERTTAEATAEQERLRSALLSSISHDLRTPLATILGSVTSLRQLGDQMTPADRDDLLAAIEEETDRLSRLVADLLAMTRLEAGLDARRDWVDVADAIRAAADHLGRVHPTHPIVLRLDETAATIRGDATLLEQVVFNLGDNAAKASPVGTAIEIDLARDGDDLAVAVTDHGRGLSTEEIERLFAEGQANAPGRMPGGRGGLGLGIARRVVAAMGGRLAAASPSPAGPGTRVTLHLPVDVPPSPPNEPSSP